MPKGGAITSLKDLAETFTPKGGMFSPGTPPTSPDEQPVRALDFPSGINLQIGTRQYETFSFAQLRSFANNELVRLAIETRKDQVEGYNWNIKLKDRKGRAGLTKDPRIEQIEDFFMIPDGTNDFSTWIRMLLEEMFVLDAPALERRFDRSGNLIGLDVVPGDTIKLLVDDTGRVPKPPYPAFQQVIKGRIWADLTTDDLLYMPRNKRANHLYGYSQVEQIIVTITTAIQRQTQQLAYMTDTNIPAGILNMPESWTFNQIKEYQEWLDGRLSGADNVGTRTRVISVPAGVQYQAFKDSPIKSEFDEWLARIVCYAFSLPPTAFVQQQNRATAETEKTRAEEEGLLPILKWVKRLLDRVIQIDMGHRDLEFVWDMMSDFDVSAEGAYDVALKNGSMTIDEVRAQRGQDPYPNGIGSKPIVYVTGGVTPLEDSIEVGQALAESNIENAQNPPDEGGPGMAPNSPKGPAESGEKKENPAKAVVDRIKDPSAKEKAHQKQVDKEAE